MWRYIRPQTIPLTYELEGDNHMWKSSCNLKSPFCFPLPPSHHTSYDFTLTSHQEPINIPSVLLALSHNFFLLLPLPNSPIIIHSLNMDMEFSTMFYIFASLISSFYVQVTTRMLYFPKTGNCHSLLVPLPGLP